MAIKQISDLSSATLDDLNDNCQFVMDDSNKKTKKVSFFNLIQKIIEKVSSSNLIDSINKKIDNINKEIKEIDVRIGMPDYKATPVNVKAAINASTDKKWTATENGWLNIVSKSLFTSAVFINGVSVMSTEANIVPISRGDIVTCRYNDPSDIRLINFYPCKAV